MENNLILELRQKSSTNNLANGDFSVSLAKSLVINENDEVSISKVFIDNVSTSDNKIIIEKDITVSMDVIKYQNNCYPDQKVYADDNIKEDGRDYIWCDAILSDDPRNNNLVVVTEFKVAVVSGSPENTIWGDSTKKFPIKWEGYDNQKYYSYCIIPQEETNLFYPSRSFFHVRGISILCRESSLSPDDSTHVWADNLCQFDEVTARTAATNDICMPIITTHTIDIDAGQYLPDDICEVFNNSMTKNNNVDDLLTLKTLTQNPFLDCTANAIKIMKTNDWLPPLPKNVFMLEILSINGAVVDGGNITIHYSTDVNNPYGNSFGFKTGQTGVISLVGQSTAIINQFKTAFGAGWTEANLNNLSIGLEPSPYGSFTFNVGATPTSDFNISFPTSSPPALQSAVRITNFVSTNRTYFSHYDAETYYRPDGLSDADQTTSNNTWIGASQIEMKYDSNSNFFFWNFMHLPFYANGEIATGVGQVSASAGPNVGKLYRKDKFGGFAFHHMNAYDRGGDPVINYYDFWDNKLGFKIDEICVDFGHTTNTTGVGITILPDFSKGHGAIWKDGISVTSARPTLDSMIDKSPHSGANAFAIPPIATLTDQTKFSSTSELNVEIFASSTKLAPVLLNYGYYQIELTAGFINEMIGGTKMTKNINGIVNRYYSLGTYTSSEQQNMVYIHKGSPKILSDIGVRILDSDGVLAEGIGDDNTIFISITRNQQPSQELLQEQKVLENDAKQL